jgi:hypothetical protein
MVNGVKSTVTEPEEKPSSNQHERAGEVKRKARRFARRFVRRATVVLVRAPPYSLA